MISPDFTLSTAPRSGPLNQKTIDRLVQWTARPSYVQVLRFLRGSEQECRIARWLIIRKSDGVLFVDCKFIAEGILPSEQDIEAGNFIHGYYMPELIYSFEGGLRGWVELCHELLRSEKTCQQEPRISSYKLENGYTVPETEDSLAQSITYLEQYGVT